MMMNKVACHSMLIRVLSDVTAHCLVDHGIPLQPCIIQNRFDRSIPKMGLDLNHRGDIKNEELALT